MIPGAIITEWRAHSPWTSAAHVEQDLIIARALVELYGSPEFSAHMLFRGGTALHKLVVHPSARYSEDLDFVQMRPDPSARCSTSSVRNSTRGSANHDTNTPRAARR